MLTLPILVAHIAGGTIGFLSGAVALAARKGSTLHRVSGTAFFVSMLTMAAGAAVLATLEGKTDLLLGGLFVFYLVATAWAAVKRKENTIGAFEVAAMLLVLAYTSLMVRVAWLGLNGAHIGTHDTPAMAYIFLVPITVAAAMGDVKVVMSGGIAGVPRIARHLWRMCTALFFAAGSFFTNALPRILPGHIGNSPLLLLPMLVPIVLMIFWLIRVRQRSWSEGEFA